MSQLDQIQITYVPGEDRLLMRVSTQDGNEFRFWLTRRFVRALRPALGQTLERHTAVRAPASVPQAQREVMEFEREQAVTTSDFATPFRESERTLPLGDAPVLLTRLKLEPRGNGSAVLSVGPEQGAGVDLALSPRLMHSVSALLDSALTAADWDLALAKPERPAQGASPPSIN